MDRRRPSLSVPRETKETILMPKKLPENIRDGYEAERTGLLARIDACGADDARAEGWAARVADLGDLLGVSKRAAKKETRPATGAAESRPGE